MVQYFAEQLDGFSATEHGWVQSYGTRCVRPPILFGDVARPRPMTVEWATYAQSLTGKPVKGMLTGPVTILAWSFVRDDQPLADTANQVALAIRDEAVDLQAAGIPVIQVDEPALRELLPLRAKHESGVPGLGGHRVPARDRPVSPTPTQIHTHLCYSEFGEVIAAIAALDADVTSIEAARSQMEVLDDLQAVGFARSVGPGVYDIHSPRVPSADEIVESLRAASGRPDRTAVGEPRLRPEDAQTRRGGRVTAEHGHRGPRSARRPVAREASPPRRQRRADLRPPWSSTRARRLPSGRVGPGW